eukprot:TRINITY_DN25780_c0_g1_i1.p1 TRINITY_DN25780_c0_g1~~TRINITY_DN25780_c0_g1_i1.p1  ORF type:complete len:933 (+),score=250.33 TRINITY_DN25780_c0_g1_i1:81-2801(+)
MEGSPLPGPCCTARCARADWASWDSWHNVRHGVKHTERPPQYNVSPLEKAAFRYVFADTFNGELSLSELFGTAIAVGGAVVNMAAISLNAFTLLFTQTNYPAYKALVQAVICFEFVFFVFNLVKWIYVMYVESVSDDEVRNTVVFQRNRVKACMHLGELNVFSLMTMLKPDVLLSHLTHLKKTASTVRGVAGPIILVLGTGTLMLGAIFSVLGILAKLSLMEFIFESLPWGWTVSNWIAAGGFINNLIRRDRSEQHKVKLLEFAAVGHYVPTAGFQKDVGNNLVCDFYSDMLRDALDDKGDGMRTAPLGQLEIFAFFANLKSHALLRFHEMAYGAGSAASEARRALALLLVGGGTEAWHRVGEACDAGDQFAVLEGLGPDAPSPELLARAWRAAGTLDPLRCDPIEGTGSGKPRGAVRYFDKCINCACRKEKLLDADDADGGQAASSPQAFREAGRRMSGVKGLHQVMVKRPRLGIGDGHSAEPPPAGLMMLRVVQCTGLQAEKRCGGGVDSDPFVEVACADGYRFSKWSWGRTHVGASGDVDPSFGEVFIFQHRPMHTTEVLVDVFDHDIGGTPDRLGTACFSVTPALAAELAGTSGWKDLRLPLEAPQDGDEYDAGPSRRRSRRRSGEDLVTRQERRGQSLGHVMLQLGLSAPPQSARPSACLNGSAPPEGPGECSGTSSTASTEEVPEARRTPPAAPPLLPFPQPGSRAQAVGMQGTSAPHLDARLCTVVRQRADGKLVVAFDGDAQHHSLPMKHLASAAELRGAEPYGTHCDPHAEAALQALREQLRESERRRAELQDRLLAREAAELALSGRARPPPPSLSGSRRMSNPLSDICSEGGRQGDMQVCSSPTLTSAGGVAFDLATTAREDSAWGSDDGEDEEYEEDEEEPEPMSRSRDPVTRV